MMISRSEIDHFLARAAEYNPKPKAKAGDDEGGVA
jgi:hypothetical protein